MNLILRFMLGMGLITAAGFYYLIDWVITDVRPRYLEATEEPLVDMVNILAAAVETSMEHEQDLRSAFLLGAMDQVGKRQLKATIYRLTKQHVNMRVYITDKHGIVVYDSDGGKSEGLDYSRWNDVYLTLRGQYGARSSQRDPHDPSSSIMYVSAPIYHQSAIAGVISIGKPTTSVARFVTTARQQIIFVGTLTAITMLVLGALLSFWLNRPIQQLTAYARAIRDGQRTTPPKIRSREIATLSQAYEEMRDALEGRKYVERYVQSLTHELKSPLSSLRGAAELLREEMPHEQRQKFLNNITGETARIQTIVDKMLQLAEIESRKGLDKPTLITVDELLQEIRNSFLPLYERKNVRLDVCPAPACFRVNGERFLLLRALSNLLQNALDFSPAAAAVTVVSFQQGSYVRIEVRDQGPGIPDYALEKVFERFYSLPRPDTRMKSTGLGLPFVREVAQLHVGFVELGNIEGNGTVAALSLPLA